MSTAPGPVLEILSFLASDALLQDETLTHPAFEQIRTWNGLERVYEGVSVDEEDPKRRWIIIQWTTYEDHKSLMDDPVVYPKVIETLGKCFGGEVEMRHARFSDTTVMALSSPVTEVARIELKDTALKADFENGMRNFMDDAHHAPIAKEHAPFVFGETLESPGSYFFVGGWDSKQAHIDSAADPESIKPHVEKIGKYATFKVYHFRVREYGLRNNKQK
ncbi:hypothetical protein D9756_004911 [Leucocoprinus leucothites]|uniref:ABM domain-containing protein n=1 Tax=Leucocoprinus leucothites TaxID=201217 RepID=A0A8H5LKD1_9AGAR|nr:hypothetical protein D9756_004911 [Leucoagaricus leucothites]